MEGVLLEGVPLESVLLEGVPLESVLWEVVLLEVIKLEGVLLEGVLWQVVIAEVVALDLGVFSGFAGARSHDDPILTPSGGVTTRGLTVAAVATGVLPIVQEQMYHDVNSCPLRPGRPHRTRPG